MKLDIDNPKFIYQHAKAVVAKPEFPAIYDYASELANEIADRISKMGRANAPDSLKKQLRAVVAIADELCAQQFIAESTASLKRFDVEELSDDALMDYIAIVGFFHATKNNYYAIDAFVFAACEGMGPPLWAHKILALGLGEFINREERDPATLPKYLGLTGNASGANSPWVERQKHDSERKWLADTVILIWEFGMSRNSAARAVILKHKLDVSLSTVKRRLQSHYGFMLHNINIDTPPLHLSVFERTKFVNSFPPKAKTIIRKASSR